MNISILAKEDYDNVSLIYDILSNEINPHGDKLIINSMPQSIIELTASELSEIFGIDCEITDSPSCISDATLVIYESGEYELCSHSKPLNNNILDLQVA